MDATAEACDHPETVKNHFVGLSTVCGHGDAMLQAIQQGGNNKKQTNKQLTRWHEETINNKNQGVRRQSTGLRAAEVANNGVGETNRESAIVVLEKRSAKERYESPSLG
jgi:hypothetical protein